jgi:hypothetical protein
MPSHTADQQQNGLSRRFALATPPACRAINPPDSRRVSTTLESEAVATAESEATVGVV